MGAPLNRRFSSRQPGVNSLFYLRLLGAPVLEADGEALTGRATQRRRLALLALLATAHGRSVPRGRITALLWPDKDDDQARHLLSVAGYDIRKELGEDAVASRGEELVLDPLLIRTDVADFDDACVRRDWDAALALYRGPFLDGFVLGGSVEFEHWVDQERGRLERRHREALVARAESVEATGDHAAAAEAWRHAANADRYDSRVALRLLRSLESAGNRAAALQFARIHETLIREEFGAAPDASFVEAAAELRTARAATTASAPSATTATPPATPTSTPTPAAHDPVAGPALANGAQSSTTGSAGRIGGAESMVRPTAVIALLLAAGGVGGYMALRAAEPTEAVAVAVLPFTSPDETDRAFASGLSETIMDVLGKVDGVRVPAWSASLATAGLPAAEAARRLGVDYALSGIVRREGDRLRIRVELSSADGFATWSHTYHAGAGSLFATWDEIALAVLDAVAPELDAEAPSPLVGGTSSEQAYTAYINGRVAWMKRTPEGLAEARHYFEEALRHDARYARALAGLADAYALLGAYGYGVMPPDSAYPRALEAARRAVAIAPELAEAHAALANALFAYEWDWQGAEAAYRRAIELKPTFSEARHWYSLYLIAMGRERESIEQAERALAHDSLSLVMRTGLARHRYFRGDHTGALADYRRVLQREPTFVTAHLGAGMSLLELERYDEAIAAFERALALLGRPHPLTVGLLGHAYGRAGRRDDARRLLGQLLDARAAGQWVAPEYLALVHLGLGDTANAIDGFEAAYADRSGAIAFLAVDPLAAPLRSDPRFQRLMQVVPRRGRGSP